MAQRPAHLLSRNDFNEQRLETRASQRHRNIVFPTAEMEDAADKYPG
jgi:hypothetical protein